MVEKVQSALVVQTSFPDNPKMFSLSRLFVFMSEHHILQVKVKRHFIGCISHMVHY